MKLNEDGINFLINLEGFKLCSYKDTKGIWTIGIGSTRHVDNTPVKKDEKISKNEVYKLFHITAVDYENAINKYIKISLTQNQFNALFALCYNIGITGFATSTVLKRINNKDTEENIKEAWMRWTKQKELIGRRKKEINLYFTK